MKSVICILLVIVVIWSCKSKGGSKVVPQDQPPGSEGITAAQLQKLGGCYRMIIARDTAELQLDLAGMAVRGTLTYNRFEKDDNKGDVTGIIEKSLIKGWYEFKSEGVVSVKEICFKINGETLEEAYGDVELKHDTAYFKYPGTLRYEVNNPYKKVMCY